MFQNDEEVIWDLQDRLSRSEDVVLSLRAKVDSLKEALSIVNEGLQFYGDKYNWRTNSGKVGITPLTDGSDFEMVDGKITGGKKARDVLLNPKVVSARNLK